MIRIRIAPIALADILLAIKICPVEISGLGKVRKISDEEFLIEEVIVFDQVCSRSRTEFDENAYGRFLHQMMKAGKGEEINHLRLWWHSHVYSEARWSPTDNENIQSFDGSDYLISIVGNKYNQLTVRFDRFGDRAESYDGLDLSYGDLSLVKSLMKEREAMIRDCVSKKVTVAPEDDR